MTKQQWEALLDIVNEFQEMFPEGLTFIGGIAVYAYAISQETTLALATQSHDADFVLGVPEYVELRDLVALTTNRRLSKQAFVQGGFEFDVYVEGQADLLVPVDEIISHSEERSGIRVAAIEHLLVLKADAVKNRKGTSKGDKDEEDIVRILLVSEQRLRWELLARLDESLIAEIERAVRGDACLRLARGDNLFRRDLGEKAEEKFNEMKVAYQGFVVDEPSQKPDWETGNATDIPLNPSPVAPPFLKAEPTGRPADFFEVVSKAGMRNVVSTYNPPDIRIHEGSRDFKAVRPGKVVYCLAEANLPSNDRERNREILRRLAYGFHDWAARETVARYHRDLKRSAIEPHTSLAGGKASLKIMRYLKANPGSSVGEIVAATGLAQPNVSRSLSQWQASGKVVVERHGRLKKCFLSETKDNWRGAEACMRA